MRALEPYRILPLLAVVVAALCAPASAARAGVSPVDTVTVKPLPLDTSRVLPIPLDTVTALPVKALPLQPDTVSVESVPLPKSQMRRERGTVIGLDSATVIYADSLSQAVADSLQLARFNEWKPDPIRALWLGMVFPGGGQIYNRKYWKLPIVYGGVLGCIYAVSWNAQMLRDYAQAYQDITDSDPTTSSYLEMLPLGYNISGREEHFKNVFKRKKDFYRRFRDISIFCIAGVYLLSIVDAYVDAELSTFDIGTDLSLNVGPTVIPSAVGGIPQPAGSSPGIRVQLTY